MTWRKRRQLAYLMCQFDDIDLPYTYIDMKDKDLISLIISFFKTGSELIYPAKSFFVAIVYAKCIEKYFKEDFYTILNEDDLLPDDMYFKPYLQAKSIYDDVLEEIGDIWQYESIQATYKYFCQEFLIGANNQAYGKM